MACRASIMMQSHRVVRALLGDLHMAQSSGRGPVKPGTSSNVKTIAGKVLEAGRATPGQAKTLAASVMRHEPEHKGPRK